MGTCVTADVAPQRRGGISVSLQLVSIRPVGVTDGRLIEQYASDPRIAATSHVPYSYPADEGAMFVRRAAAAWRSGRQRTYAVVVNQAFAGIVSLMAVDWREPRAQVGYWIGVPYWGRGIATEAVKLVVAQAYQKYRLRTLIAGCLADNVASIRVLEKVGFQEGPPVTYGGPDQRFVGRAVRTFHLDRTAGVQTKPALRVPGP